MTLISACNDSTNCCSDCHNNPVVTACSYSLNSCIDSANGCKHRSLDALRESLEQLLPFRSHSGTATPLYGCINDAAPVQDHVVSLDAALIRDHVVSPALQLVSPVPSLDVARIQELSSRTGLSEVRNVHPNASEIVIVGDVQDPKNDLRFRV